MELTCDRMKAIGSEPEGGGGVERPRLLCVDRTQTGGASKANGLFFLWLCGCGGFPFSIFFIYASWLSAGLLALAAADFGVAGEIRRSGARLYADAPLRFGCVADATRGSWESVTCGACSEWGRQCR